MGPSGASPEVINPSIQPVGNSHLIPLTNRMSRWPWWALITVLLGILFVWVIATDSTYQAVYRYVVVGLSVTIAITIIAYPLALLLGLIVALGRISRNVFAYQLSTFYVEIVRGLPTLVLILYVAYGLTPVISNLINGIGSRMVEWNLLPQLATGMSTLRVRDISSETRGVFALVIAYAAFLSEIFRAGIESVERGQMEAARALGMTYWQAMRHVILRQAIRQVLPPLGNDFISMLKDSSLLSAIGAAEITQKGGFYATTYFLPNQSYGVLAFLYLTMTLLLSMIVKWIERRMARERRV